VVPVLSNVLDGGMPLRDAVARPRIHVIPEEDQLLIERRPTDPTVVGALEEREFEGLLSDVGFEDASLEPTRIYEPEDARVFIEEAGLDLGAVATAVEGRIMSAFVRARKPTSATSEKVLAVANAEPCCAPGCCGN
jgi:hypothetical protein